MSDVGIEAGEEETWATKQASNLANSSATTTTVVHSHSPFKWYVLLCLALFCFVLSCLVCLLHPQFFNYKVDICICILYIFMCGNQRAHSLHLYVCLLPIFSNHDIFRLVWIVCHTVSYNYVVKSFLLRFVSHCIGIKALFSASK